MQKQIHTRSDKALVTMNSIPHVTMNSIVYSNLYTRARKGQKEEGKWFLKNIK